MPMYLNAPLQTMERVYEQICDGETPWVALGDFLNEWFIYCSDRRAELVADPIVLRKRATLKELQWATFIAASVEYLCWIYDLTCPHWAYKSCFQLKEPWYHALYLHEDVRAHLEHTTPEPFKRRNIYCGDRVYLDKRAVISRPV